MKLTALVCGVAVGGLLALGQAQAADLLYSQPAPAMAQSYGGPYFGVKGGVNWTGDDYTFDADGAGATLDGVDFDTGFNASIVAGYAFGSRWGMLSPRLEVELGYLQNDADTYDVNVAAAGGVGAASGEMNALYGFVNLLLDIPMGWGFTPFIGGGIGFADVRFDNIDQAPAAAPSILNTEDTAFAWNLTAGLSYDISRNITLDVAYRFIQFNDVDALSNVAASGLTSDDLDNHQVNVGVRVHL